MEWSVKPAERYCGVLILSFPVTQSALAGLLSLVEGVFSCNEI